MLHSERGERKGDREGMEEMCREGEEMEGRVLSKRGDRKEGVFCPLTF